MHHAPPSIYLPGLVPVPLPSAILDSLSRLAAAYATPPSAFVDLRPSVYDYAAPSTSVADRAEDGDDETGDAFELGFARGWLEKVLALGSRALARGMDETGEWERAVDEAARLLADLSGPSAQGSTTKTYLLPDPRHALPPPLSYPYPTPPPTRPSSTAPFLPRTSPSTALPSAPSDTSSSTLRLTIRDGTLLEASTGHRTWGSASILAHLLAASPSRFFPALSASTSSPSSPLRVLELGSGTGLVGLTAAAVLSRLGVGARRGAEVVLSDGGDEPQAVLDNLRENVAANEGAIIGGVSVRVERLDWRDYVLPLEEGSSAPDAEERFDVLLGTDLVYERGQATLLHAATAGLLRFPSSASTSSTSRPTFWLALPLRPTHADEDAEVASLFPSPSSTTMGAPPASHLRRIDPASGKTYRLVTVEREELLGPSGFAAARAGAGRAGRGGAATMGELRYCVLRIEWKEVP